MKRGTVDRLILASALFALYLICGPAISALSTGQPAQAPTVSDRVTALEAWRQSHQRDDDKQFAEIDDLHRQLVDVTLADEKRLTVLETQYVEAAQERATISRNIWALIVGVFIQLLNVIWSLVKQRPAGQELARERHRNPEEDRG